MDDDWITTFKNYCFDEKDILDSYSIEEEDSKENEKYLDIPFNNKNLKDNYNNEKLCFNKLKDNSYDNLYNQEYNSKNKENPCKNIIGLTDKQDENNNLFYKNGNEII